MKIKKEDQKQLIKMYKVHTDQNKAFLRVRKGLLLLLGLIIVYQLLGYQSGSTEQSILGLVYDYFSQICLMYLLVHLNSYFMHCFIARFLLKQNGYRYTFGLKERKIGTFIIRNLYLFIFSPDYFWAKVFKREVGIGILSDKTFVKVAELEKSRLLKKFYIERSNWINLGITLFIVIVGFALYTFNGLSTNNWTVFFMFFVLLRTFSRSIEIIFAFYKDIVNRDEKLYYLNQHNEYYTLNNDRVNKNEDSKKSKSFSISPNRIEYDSSYKNTLLLPKGRTSLALHSLFEMILLYSVLYLLLVSYNKSLSLNIIPSELLEYRYVYQFIIYSFSQSVTLPSVLEIGLISMVQTLQVLTSLILIVMSLAYYLGKDHKLSPLEKNMYSNFKYKDMEKNKREDDLFIKENRSYIDNSPHGIELVSFGISKGISEVYLAFSVHNRYGELIYLKNVSDISVIQVFTDQGREVGEYSVTLDHEMVKVTVKSTEVEIEDLDVIIGINNRSGLNKGSCFVIKSSDLRKVHIC
ncbi:hypothetical protein RYX45_14360 [Alkalihalophilus pseudofirmus]|uniref:Uncharacterized protein n=1 Tax=Alkalihalophilus pseudofirmus TaxID=79885 RepID=A0AAJ2NPT6_ALKPS|nr:hypothetical protein [Alkalihalophilus pseudofirmus]MDV2886369.1 hypothetical protein [Alkalihalophilus pseudofirmus]